MHLNPLVIWGYEWVRKAIEISNWWIGFLETAYVFKVWLYKLMNEIFLVCFIIGDWLEKKNEMIMILVIDDILSLSAQFSITLSCIEMRLQIFLEYAVRIKV